jgi:hypothetical protein
MHSVIEGGLSERAARLWKACCLVSVANPAGDHMQCLPDRRVRTLAASHCAREAIEAVPIWLWFRRWRMDMHISTSVDCVGTMAAS